MKKLFVLSLLSIAFNVMAEDYYLYWMVDKDATLDTDTPLSGTYYAKVKDASTGDYLNLYRAPGAESYGTEYMVNLASSRPTFAGIFSAIPSETSTYFVELYNTSGTSPNSWVGQATLEWGGNNFIASGSVALPPDWASASRFQSVPEPTSGMLLLLGVAGLALRRKNKKA